MKSCILETRHCNTFHKISQRKSEGSNWCLDTLILRGVLKWIRLQYMMLYGLYATSNSETVIYGILNKFHKKWTRKSRVQRDYKVKIKALVICHFTWICVHQPFNRNCGLCGGPPSRALMLSQRALHPLQRLTLDSASNRYGVIPSLKLTACPWK